MFFTIVAQASGPSTGYAETDQAAFFGFIGIAAALVFASKYLVPL